MDYQTAAEATSPHPDADHQRHFEDRSEIDASETRAGDLPEYVRKYGRSLRAVRTRYKYIRGSDGLTELYDIQCNPDGTEDLDYLQ